jgi:hypothetical protein
MQPNTAENDPQLLSRSTAAFEALVQHWAQARVDGPLEVMKRFDEAAKQLIALGAILQGLLFAVVNLGVKGHVPPWMTAIISVPLMALVFCGARVICTVPVRMEAIDTYLLMKRATEHGGIGNKSFTEAVQTWCRTVDDLAKRKHRWLIAANSLLLLSFIGGLVFLYKASR